MVCIGRSSQAAEALKTPDRWLPNPKEGQDLGKSARLVLDSEVMPLFDVMSFPQKAHRQSGRGVLGGVKEAGRNQRFPILKYPIP